MKKRSAWPFVAGGVLLAICAAFLLLALRPKSAPNPVVPPVTVVVVVPTFTAAAPTPNVQPSPTENLPPELAAALEHFNQNPTDPAANLRLSLAYWDAGRPRESMERLGKAGELADAKWSGAENARFYQEAGGEFKHRQAWLPAAAMYLRAIKSFGFGGHPPQELVDNFHEALYKASVFPDIFSYLPYDAVSRVEQPIAMVAQARNDYYNGKTADGRALLNKVKNLKPGLPEAILLEAEMDAQEGKGVRARQNLNLLLANLSTPDWVREMAQDLFNKIP